MIWKIREIFAERKLKKLIRNWKNNGLLNTDTAKKALVLINFSDVDAFDVQTFREIFDNLNPNLHLKFLTYCKNPKTAEDKQLSNEWSVFTKQDLNFDLTPQNVDSNAVEIVLDFTTEYEIPMLFQLLCSKANLRMGAQKEWNENYLDFMIKSKEQKDFLYAPEQLVHYLNKINTNNAA